MVQFFELGQSSSGKLAERLGEQLGSSLGEGLGRLTADYYANKAINEVVNNPEFKNKPLSDRWQALQKATQGHGAAGDRMLLKQLQLEAQHEKEAETRRAKREQSNLSRTYAAYERGEPLTPEQEEIITPQIRMAHKKATAEAQKGQAAINKANQPPKPPGGVTAQPVPEEIANKIDKILEDSKGLNADQLAVKFAKEGVPDINSSRYIENRRRQDELAPKERLEIHNLSKDTDKLIRSDAESARKRLRSFETMKKDIETGKTNPKTFKNLVANAFSGSFFEGLLRDPESEEFKAASFNVYEGLKNVFGTRLSDQDLKLASTKVPDITKTNEANKKIIEFLEFQDKINVEKEKIANQIIKENGGYRPIDYDIQLNERLDSKYGAEAEEKVKAAANADKKPFSKEIAKEFLIKAKGDKELAKTLAREEGYEF